MTQPLPRFVDEKISRGVLNSELRSIAASGDVVHFAEDVIFDKVRPHTFNGRRLGPGEINGVVDRLVEAFKAHRACIDVSQRRARKPLIPSKDYRYVTGQFIDSSIPGTGTIMSVRVKIFQRGYSLNVCDTPFSFHRHAAERLLQRLPEDKPRDPMATIGKALQASASFLTPSLRWAHAIPNQALAVPFLGGLLLGEVRAVPFEHLRCETVRTQRANVDDRKRVGLHAALGPEAYDGRNGAPDLYLTFRAKTYVGPRELRPEQRAFVERVKEFMDRHGEAFAYEGWVALHGAATQEELADAKELGIVPNLNEEGFERGYGDLRRLFQDRGVLSAMGASGPPAHDVVSFRKAAVMRSQERRENLEGMIESLKPNKVEDFLRAEGTIRGPGF